MKRDLLIFGTSSFAEIVDLYFTRDANYRTVAFTLDADYLMEPQFRGKPVVPLDRVASEFDPSTTYFHVAATYTRLNTLRREKVELLQGFGFQPASFVSPYAFVDPSATIGEHAFIFEHNVIQPYSQIGDRVVLWSGNHIGHHSTISNDVFVSSHVVVSGHCSIGERTFLGVNASIGNNVNIGKDNWVLPGTIILADTDDNELWRPSRSTKAQTLPRDKFLPSDQ